MTFEKIHLLPCLERKIMNVADHLLSNYNKEEEKQAY